MKNCYKELPPEYIEVYSIDAKNKKTGIFLNIGSLILLLIVFLITYFLKLKDYKMTIDNKYYLELLLFAGLIIIYMILHEIVHGIFYKILTKEKLTFGLSWSCAFCGVPNVYTNKKVSIIAALSPFIIFNIIFIPLIIFLPPSNFLLLLIILFSLHFGGCIGDIYLSILLLFKFNNEALINDTGAKQTIYIKNK